MCAASWQGSGRGGHAQQLQFQRWPRRRRCRRQLLSVNAFRFGVPICSARRSPPEVLDSCWVSRRAALVPTASIPLSLPGSHLYALPSSGCLDAPRAKASGIESWLRSVEGLSDSETSDCAWSIRRAPGNKESGWQPDDTLQQRHARCWIIPDTARYQGGPGSRAVASCVMMSTMLSIVDGESVVRRSVQQGLVGSGSIPASAQFA